MDPIFFELGIIIILATIGGFVSKTLKQPLIPAYVIAGILIGPIFNLVSNQEIIATFSEIGIAFLLFMVGLEIEFKRLKDVGLIAILGGSVQVLALFLSGFGVAKLLGFETLNSFYLGMVLAFSSTMVVIKLFSDKKELDTLHGRIVLGLLLMQDFFAILCLAFITSGSGADIFINFFEIILKGGALFLAILFVGKYIFPHLFKIAAKSTEILLLSSLSVCFLFGILFNKAGLSVAIGSFIAGLILGNLEYNLEIAGRMKSLRDFFSTLFFVSLGMQFVIWELPNIILPIIIFSLFVIIIKPIITIVICHVFGYKRKTAFLSSLSLAQVSEFSLIILSVGLGLGVISNRIMTIAIALAIITITLTSYFIKFDKEIYEKFSKPLKVFEKLDKSKKDFEYIPDEKKKDIDIILIGYDRVGYSIFKKLKDLRKEFMIVDFNPEIIKQLIAQKIPCIYGDIGDLEILEKLNLRKANMIISTIPDEKTSKLLIQKTKEVNKKAMIFVTAYQVDEALGLYEMGADYVILPHFLGGDHFSLLLEDVNVDITKLIHKKLEHIQELHTRKHHGHEHPKYDHFLRRRKKTT